jgi:hypothetical protein
MKVGENETLLKPLTYASNFESQSFSIANPWLQPNFQLPLISTSANTKPMSLDFKLVSSGSQFAEAQAWFESTPLDSKKTSQKVIPTDVWNIMIPTCPRDAEATGCAKTEVSS